MPAFFFFFIIIILLIIFVQTHKHTRLAYVPAIDCTFLIATRVYNFMFSFSRLLFSYCRYVLHILFGICGPELSAAMCVRVLCWCMLQRELIVCSRFSIARQRRRQRRRQKRHLCVRIDIALPNARWSRYNQRFGYLYAFFPTCNRCLFPFFLYIFSVRNFFSLFCKFYAIQKKRERERRSSFISSVCRLSAGIRDHQNDKINLHLRECSFFFTFISYVRVFGRERECERGRVYNAIRSEAGANVLPFM